MLKYEYMVIYSSAEGMGRCCVIRDREVENYDDVEGLDTAIKELNKMHNKFVTSFKLLREFED